VRRQRLRGDRLRPDATGVARGDPRAGGQPGGRRHLRSRCGGPLPQRRSGRAGDLRRDRPPLGSRALPGAWVMRLEGKVAVITGAGSGMGRVAALMFAAEGARVVVAEFDERGGAETERLVAAAGGEASFIKTDVSREEDARAMAAAA